MAVRTPIIRHLVFKSYYRAARSNLETASGRSGHRQKEELYEVNYSTISIGILKNGSCHES